MNVYEIQYKSESISSKVSLSDISNEYGHCRNELYYDLNGKVAYKGIKYVELITLKVRAVSKEVVRKVYTEETMDDYGHPVRRFYDLEFGLVEEEEYNPFEVLANKNYCRTIENKDRQKIKDLGELDLFCADDVQEFYSKMNVEERERHLEEFVVYDDRGW